jgi:toxin ParE1/3/4
MNAELRYEVRLTAGAEQDLSDLVNYVAEHDSPGKADDLLDNILVTAQALENLPQRGSVPRELLALGIRDYRQTFFKPYRLIYQVQDLPEPLVHIVIVADGRRDMVSVLQQRLLSASSFGSTPE